MKKTAIIVISLFCAATLALFGVSAIAGSEHWIKSATYAELVTDQASADYLGLAVHFKAAGLGDTTDPVAVTAAADVAATWACKNGGGQYPDAANKSTQVSRSASTGFFYVENGQITGQLVIDPSMATPFTCPAGQALTLVQVLWTNITVHSDVIATDAQLKDVFAACDPSYCL